MVKLLTFETVEALAQASTLYFVSKASEAISQNGNFIVALSGGSTPKRMYELLSKEPLKNQIDWSKVHIFWSDERFVDHSNSDSTYLMTAEALLNHVPIPKANIHAVTTSNISAEESALDYEREIKFSLPQKLPVFDLILLGIGPDGHTASLFPHHEGLAAQPKKLVIPVYNSPKPPPTRITFTYTLINAAKEVLILAAGTDKAEPIRQLMSENTSIQDLPVSGINPTNGYVMLMTDQAAASQLDNMTSK